MGVWDKTTPVGTDNISEGDDRIRELKDALEEALSSHGTFPGGSPGSAPIYVPLAIVSGTKMLFYQASVPTGWTVDDTVNGYIFAGVTEGSTNGGSVAAASALGSEAAHTHGPGSGSGALNAGAGGGAAGINITQDTYDGTRTVSYLYTVAGAVTGTASTGLVIRGTSSAGSSHTHEHITADHAQARTICGTKD